MTCRYTFAILMIEVLSLLSITIVADNYHIRYINMQLCIYVEQVYHVYQQHAPATTPIYKLTLLVSKLCAIDIVTNIDIRIRSSCRFIDGNEFESTE